jgi:hypothetical protein
VSGDQAQDTTKEAVAWHTKEAQDCAEAQRWFGAAFHSNQLALLEPRNWRHLASRGNARAELEEWDKAASDFDQAAAFGAGARTESNRAILRLHANDEPGFRAICASLLDAFGQTDDGPTANTVAWTCSISTASAVDQDRLVRLAQLAVAHRRTRAYLHTLGAGRHQDAVDALTEGIEVHGRGGDPYDWLFLAMANHGLGRTDEGRQWFDKAVRGIDQAIEQRASGGAVDPSFTWISQIELRVLRREAEELLSTERAVQAAPHE